MVIRHHRPSNAHRVISSATGTATSENSSAFFFQAKDGIRCATVTGVQTCALPISAVRGPGPAPGRPAGGGPRPRGEPRADVLPRDPSADPPSDPGRRDHRGTPDVRRLLHPAAPGEHGRHEDDRELHHRLARRPDLRLAGFGAHPRADGAADRPDRVLPAEHGPGGTGARGVSASASANASRRRLRALMTNPWARPRFLWVIGIAYVVWTLVPVLTAALFSFNSTRSISLWAGFSLRWYVGDPNESVLHDPDLRHAVLQSLKLAAGAVLVAVPIGVGFGLALDKWRGRGSGSSNFVMLFSFITPELIIAVSLFLLFVNPFRFVGLGTTAQLLGLVLLAIPYAVIIIRARLLSLGLEYEEDAMDLGASPVQALRRITLPLLAPAIFASAAIIFAFTLDDFVMVKQLAKDESNETVAMAIYGAARTAPSPAVNAVGTLLLLTSTVVITLAYVVFRRSARRSGTGFAADREAIPV